MWVRSVMEYLLCTRHLESKVNTLALTPVVHRCVLFSSLKYSST